MGSWPRILPPPSTSFLLKLGYKKQFLNELVVGGPFPVILARLRVFAIVSGLTAGSLCSSLPAVGPATF